jgi:heme-degrading monooxygenase HmoA
MIVTLLEVKLRPEADGPEYQATAARMYEIAVQMPGFVSHETLKGEDGREIDRIVFESEETLLAWRNHPEHLQAQKRGREFFYESYSVQVCKTIRSYSFQRQEPTGTAAAE